MKAIVYTEYGPPDVLRLKDVEKPTPKDNELLVKVHAASVTTSDCNVRDSVFVPAGLKFIQRLAFGLRKPNRTTPGIELAGEIEAVGGVVKQFKAGDQVFGTTVIGRLGAYAEYTCLPEAGVVAIKPANLTYEEAAVVPIGASTALFFLRDLAHIQKGQNPDPRRFGRGRHLCDTTGQVLWGTSHRGMQYHKYSIGEIAGSRPGH